MHDGPTSPLHRLRVQEDLELPVRTAAELSDYCRATGMILNSSAVTRDAVFVVLWLRLCSGACRRPSACADLWHHPLDKRASTRGI